jgi:hypothetical protein
VYDVFKPWPVHLTHRVLLSMAPVVHIETNGSQALLLFDDARKDLENNGYLVLYRGSRTSTFRFPNNSPSPLMGVGIK